MVMVGYMCVQSFVFMHPTIAWLQAKIVQILINCLRLFYVVYKHVSLFTKSR